jgi:peptide chain release factor 1
MQYREKLDDLESRFEQLTAAMADPEIISDGEQYRKTAKNRSDIEEIVLKYREWKKADADLQQAKGMLAGETDPDLVAMAQEEIAGLEPAIQKIEQELRVLLLPKDPNDDKNIVLEIRAGTGGDEATLFADEVFRMYTRFAELKRWKVEVTHVSHSAVGGSHRVDQRPQGVQPVEV